MEYFYGYLIGVPIGGLCIVIAEIIVELLSRRRRRKDMTSEDPPYDLEGLALKFSEIQTCAEFWYRKLKAEHEALDEQEYSDNQSWYHLLSAKSAMERVSRYGLDAKNEIMRVIEELDKHDLAIEAEEADGKRSAEV